LRGKICVISSVGRAPDS